MASRHQAREFALQMLYQAEVGGMPMPEVIDGFWRHEEPVPDDVRRFATRLALGATDSKDEVDALLREGIENWRLERLGTVDRAVLRLAVFEFLHEPETPRIVVIDEAIEVAKRYGGEESGQFVNGILDAIRKRLDEAAPKGDHESVIAPPAAGGPPAKE
ncbi:MAG TPA: transcription antitermination factor NusB [Candidatus Polarisedimenticolia bacterium]|jgi:N utilization substance protein B|nr:transcription antitermination factor NusB [Candidatus Polarisedimenticolia bacterium]